MSLPQKVIALTNNFKTKPISRRKICQLYATVLHSDQLHN